MTLGNDNGTDGQTDRQTDRVRRNMRPPPREEGRIINKNSSDRRLWIRETDEVFSFVRHSA